MSDNKETSKEKPTVSFYIFWSVVGLMLFCALFNVFREKGFCFNKMAFLQDIYTEEQLVDKAILFSMDRMPGTIIHRDGRPPEKLKIYSNLAEFKQLNPDCCRLSKKGPENYSNPVYAGFIIVTYFTFYERKPYRDNINGITDDYIAYDSCGNLYDRYLY